MSTVFSATIFVAAASTAAWAMATLALTVFANLVRDVARDCIVIAPAAQVMHCTTLAIRSETNSILTRSAARLLMSPKAFTRRARWTCADLRICHLYKVETMRKATKKISKLESQPRTHKGATREANTTATQNSAPLNTGLSMMFEILTIYPGHLKGLHDHTSTLGFGKIQPLQWHSNSMIRNHDFL